MYGILGEHNSDSATVKVLVRRLAKNRSLQIKTKGFDSGGKLLKEGARHLKLFANLGIRRFIVCHDADGPDPSENHAKVMERVVRPSKIKEDLCVVIPVQEIEAWILADIQAVTKIFTGWRPRAIPHPEAQASPKEHLIRLSKADNKGRPRYSNAMHNEKLAEYLDLRTIRDKCPSFLPLAEFVGGA